MSIQKIKITNFKRFKEPFEIFFHQGVNILVARNEGGKSTILEAINLALTGYHYGRSVRNGEISQYLFNKEAVEEYLYKIKNAPCLLPPKIAIEVYYENSNLQPEYIGSANSDEATRIGGFVFSIELADRYKEAYRAYAQSHQGKIKSIPLEYYEAKWISFANEYIIPRDIKLNCSFIDATRNTYQTSSDIYVSRILKNNITEDDQVAVSQAYRGFTSIYSENEGIKKVNDKLIQVDEVQGKSITLGIDLGSKLSWKQTLVALADGIPFSHAGQGMQCVLKTELALTDKKSECSNIILIEEPESHLSHHLLQKLVSHISRKESNKQIIISTHSSFVANKLNLRNIILLGKIPTRLDSLNEDTARFFEKLSGFDTMRFALSDKTILVEGSSDDLIIQKAYYDLHNKLPSDDGIDIITVGTSFLRFLELAELIDISTIVVTDNDGKIKALERKYKQYIGVDKKKNIDICYDANPYIEGTLKNHDGSRYNYNTLEPRLYRENNLDTMNKIFGTRFKTEDEMLLFMQSNKTECAYAIFSSDVRLKYPRYIQDVMNIIKK